MNLTVYIKFSRGVEHASLLPINLSDSHFRRFFGTVIQCEIALHLWWGVVKRSPQFWIWEYYYFKWSAQWHSSGFGVFHILMYNISSFQNLERHIGKIQRKPMENLTKNSKLGKTCPPPPPPEKFSNIPHTILYSTLILALDWTVGTIKSRPLIKRLNSVFRPFNVLTILVITLNK